MITDQTTITMLSHKSLSQQSTFSAFAGGMSFSAGGCTEGGGAPAGLHGRGQCLCPAAHGLIALEQGAHSAPALTATRRAYGGVLSGRLLAKHLLVWD